MWDDVSWVIVLNSDLGFDNENSGSHHTPPLAVCIHVGGGGGGGRGGRRERERQRERFYLSIFNRGQKLSQLTKYNLFT